MESNNSFFDELYIANFVEIMAYIYHTLGAKNVAEELAQEVFLTAFRRIDMLKQHENPVGWLYITAKNVIKAFRRENENLLNCLPIEDYDNPVTDDAVAEIELFSSLTEDEAMLLQAYHLYGLTVTELADRYGISTSACKMRLKRARDKLRNT